MGISCFWLFLKIFSSWYCWLGHHVGKAEFWEWVKKHPRESKRRHKDEDLFVAVDVWVNETEAASFSFVMCA
jgi:hypothetical protein